MAKQILKNVEIRAGGYDLSTDANQLSVEETYDEVENTTFGATSHIFLPGLPKVSLSLSGFGETDSADPQVDDVIETYLAAADTPMSFTPETAADGGLIFFTKAMMLSVNRGGSVGEMYAFTVNGVGSCLLYTSDAADDLL